MDWKCSSPQSSLWASSGCTWAGPCPSYIGGSNQNTIFQVGSHWKGVEESPLLAAGRSSFDASQVTIVFLGCKHTLQAHIQFFILQSCWVLLHRAALSCLITQPVSNAWDWPRHKSLHLALLNFRRFMWAQLSIWLHKKWSVHICFRYAWIKIFNMIFWMITELRLLWTEGL